jgi:hypothetical protein
MLLTYLIDVSQNLYVPAFMLMGYASLAGLVLLTTHSYLIEEKNERPITAQAA